MAGRQRLRAAAAASVTHGTLAPCLRSTATDGTLSQLLGSPHYSYRFAEAKFAASFARAGIDLPVVPMPEYYPDLAALYPDVAEARTPVHLIFRSTEQIRLLKPARNIACFAWEFEVLKDWSGPGEHPFLDQRRMLSICDEIWVPCRFTRDVLRRHGIARVEIIPAPIDIPAAPPSRMEALAAIGATGVMPLVGNFLLSAADNARAAAARATSILDAMAPRLAAGEATLIYLAILNPEDSRKNIDALLRGFHHFLQSHPQALLLVKVLTAAARFPLQRVIAEVLPPKLASGSVFATDGIVFLNAFFDEEEMSALYRLADFYLCSSLAEGQNLPLLEAMAHGLVPVTTANTAMADYITPENAFVIATDRVAAPTPHLAGAIAGRPYSVDLASPRQVHDALQRSAQAGPAERQARAQAALEAVRDRFAHAAVWPAIAARLRAAAAPVSVS